MPPPPPVLLREGPKMGLVEQFRKALEALAGKVVVVKTPEEAQFAVDKALNGRTFIQSSRPASREAIAATQVGITSADYALADTGSLVIFTESHELRLLSLLPPCHIAVIESSRIVASLDDVFRLRPLPGGAIKCHDRDYRAEPDGRYRDAPGAGCTRSRRNSRHHNRGCNAF